MLRLLVVRSAQEPPACRVRMRYLVAPATALQLQRTEEPEPVPAKLPGAGKLPDAVTVVENVLLPTLLLAKTRASIEPEAVTVNERCDAVRETDVQEPPGARC